MAARSLILLAVTLFVCWSSADVIVRDVQNKTLHRFASEPSLFGPRLPKDGFAGHLMKSVPVDACHEVQNVSAGGTIWVALIKRQSCTFAKKVFNVQKAGYKAAIVHNVGSDDLIPMRDDGESGPFYISSVFVGESSGIALGNINRNYTILLTDESHSNSDGIIFLPFAIVLPLCTVIMCCFLCVRCAMDHLKKRRLRLSKSNLKKLPIKKFKKGSECEVCAICLEEYEEGDKLREMPCAHAYHQKCIDPWLTKNKQTCPLCNKKVFPRDNDSDLENGNEENRSNENTPLLLSRSNAEPNYGISTTPMNVLLEESDSDDASPDELPPNHIESRVEVHPKPRNVACPMMTSSTGEATTSVVAQDHPTISSSDSKDDHNPPAVAGGSAEEVDNEGFGFDEEYFGDRRRDQGATAMHPQSNADPLQVEVHGRKNLADQKNSNA